MNKKILIFITIFSLALVALSLYIISTIDPGVKPKPTAKITNVASLNIKADKSFNLQDDMGQAFNYANLQNKITVIYFGFAHCPDLCPTVLAKMKESIDLLNPVELDKIQFVFVSIDPERDSISNLHNFITQFGGHIKAVTGEQVELKKIADSLKVYYAQNSKKDAKEGDDYYVDHSSFIYLLDPQAELISQFTSDISAEEMAKQFKMKLQ